MSDYGDKDGPLFLEPVRGVREWRLTIDGELGALHQSATWVPGENVCVCTGSPDEGGKKDGEDWAAYSKRQEKFRNNGHGIADCSHGFYAYWARMGAPYGSGIQGIIEGYGEVVIGTKGFRATKARIIALGLWPRDGMWRLEQFVVDRLRANYPNVPIFESAMAMCAEFPTGKPEDFAATGTKADEGART